MSKFTKPKYFALIETLDYKENHAYQKYLLSKVGSESEVYLLHEVAVLLKNLEDEYTNIAFIKENYFPHSKDKLIANNFSILISFFEDWAAQIQLTKNESLKYVLVQDWYNDHALYHHANLIHNKLIKDIDINYADSADLNALYLSYFHHLFSSNPAKYDNKSKEYGDMIYIFENYSTIQKLLFLIEIVNRADIMNLKIDKERNLLLKSIKLKNLSFLASILYKTYLMIANDDVICFHELKDILLTNQLQKDTQIHTIVASYVVKRSMKFWNKTLIKDTKVIAQLATYGMENGVYFTNNLATATFHNLVAQLCQAFTYREMTAFVRKWLPKVNSTNPEATQSLAYATIAFYNDRFNEIFKHVWRKDFNDFNERNQAQLYHLLAAFMQRNKDPKTYKVAFQSSTYFLKRHKSKMSNHLVKSYSNLLLVLTHLAEGKPEHLDIENLIPLLYRKWCSRFVN